MGKNLESIIYTKGFDHDAKFLDSLSDYVQSSKVERVLKD